MNNEIWKEITNFSKYEISNYGNIRNIVTQKLLHLCTFKTPIFLKVFYFIS